MYIDYFDNSLLIKIIGKKLKLEADKKGFNLTKWAEKLKESGSKTTQGDLSNILNGKRGASTDKLLNIIGPIGISKNILDKIVKESEEEVYRIKHGEDLGLEKLEIKNEGQEIVTTKEEAESVLFKKNGIDKPTDDDIMAIRIALDMAKARRKMKK